jgi:hypothetical protein
MFGEIDSTEEEDVKKAPKKKHKVSGKGKGKKAKKHGKKRHHAKKISAKG